MSCTEIYAFDIKGNAYLFGTVSNSWRGAMAIWRYLEEKYLPPYIPNYMRSLGVTTAEECKRQMNFVPTRCSACQIRDMQEIWDLCDSPKLSEAERICLYTTFDRYLIKKEDIPRVVKAFKEFEGDTSLKAQAEILEKAYKDDNCMAIGWNQTSVCADNWGTYGGYDQELDKVIPYNCLNDDNHDWIFEEMEACNEELS